MAHREKLTGPSFDDLLQQVSDAYDRLRDDNDELRRQLQGKADMPASRNTGPGALFANQVPDTFEPCRQVSPCSHQSIASSCPTSIALGGQIWDSPPQEDRNEGQLLTTSVYESQASGTTPQTNDEIAHQSEDTENDDFPSGRGNDCPSRKERSRRLSDISWKETSQAIEERRKSNALRQASAVFSVGECSVSERRKKMDILRRVVRSTAFETFFCCVIVSNTVYIGFETDYMARNHSQKVPTSFYVIQYSYLFVFVLELAMRLLADGKSFWVSRSNWAWNWLDAFVVAGAIFEAVTSAIALVGETVSDSLAGVGNIRIVRIVRIARLLRIFRISRVMRFMSALRTLVYSIIGTLTSLFWAIILLILIIYTFGVIFTQVAGDHLSDERMAGETGSTKDEELATFYGSLPTSMFTLFMSIAAGISWEQVVSPLFSVGWPWAALFTIFIAFTYFAVLNIVTANFCQSAIDSAAFDQELIMHRQKMQKKAYSKLISRLFSSIDTNGSGRMSLKEMERHFQEKEVQAYLQSLELEPADAWSLFKLLDVDEDFGIEMDEFVSGCMRLRGFAKKVDLAELIQQTHISTQQMTDFMEHVDEQFKLLRRQTSSAQL